MTRRRHRDERGSIVISLAMLFPMFMLTISFSWVVNRTEFAAAAVDAAAYASARAASQSRDPATARDRARTSALATLAAQDLHCAAAPTVDVDVAQFANPVGQPANVTVRISCLVSLSDVALPGMPGQRLVWAQYTSPIDRYRARS